MGPRFEAQRVLVTGGARGIGAAACRAFHAEGAHVAVGGRRQSSVDEFLAHHGADRYIGVVGDVSTRQGCYDVVNRALDSLGGLDVLVNSAGTFADVAFESVDQAHFDSTIATNLGGVFFCSQAALPALKRSRGNIVNLASDAGLIAYAPAPTYGASKAGVVNLTRTLALEYAKSVRGNCVCPGNVETDMLHDMAALADEPQAYMDDARERAPVGRMAHVDEIAAAITYLASDLAGFTSGVALPIDGAGMTGY